MTGMKVHDGAGRLAPFINGTMQKRLLGWSVARNEVAVPIELRQLGGIQSSQARIRRREQPATLCPDADIAAAAGAQPTFEERTPERTNILSRTVLADAAHGSRFQAVKKKSGAPKFPDFSANASMPSPRPVSAVVQGTPGQISGPIRTRLTPRALTTAPEVSPPATISRPTPKSSTRRLAISASVSSMSVLLSASPN